MITKEQITQAAEKYAEQENSAWTNDYNGFVAGANFLLQNLQPQIVGDSLPPDNIISGFLNEIQRRQQD